MWEDAKSNFGEKCNKKQQLDAIESLITYTGEKDDSVTQVELWRAYKQLDCYKALKQEDITKAGRDFIYTALQDNRDRADSFKRRIYVKQIQRLNCFLNCKLTPPHIVPELEIDCCASWVR